MLWYKSWLETRWRFVIGLAVLGCMAIGVVIAYPRVAALLPLVPAAGTGGEIGRRIREVAELERDYRGYVWVQWFRQNLTQIGTVFAVLLGTGSSLTRGSEGAALFTLALPASRQRLVGVRTAIGLGEWLVLAVVPSLLIPLLSPTVDQTYGMREALVHGSCIFVVGAMYFSVAVLASTVFDDTWRPLLIAICAAFAVAAAEQLFRGALPPSMFHVMSGELYFRSGVMPWSGLIVSAAASAAMLYAASINVARRDF